MNVNIDINRSERVVAAESGRDLLSALADDGIYVPSSCGGRGVCGLCKVKVLSGAGPRTAGELRRLSEPERDNGLRLSCQVRTDADLELDVPPEVFKARKFRGRVKTLRPLTHDTVELRVRLLEPDRMEFRAGQFVQLVVPPYGRVTSGAVRAYSISSPPSRQRELAFDIRLAPKGVASGWLTGRLAEGDEVSLIGPMGEFGLREGDADAVFIAAGSGLAPLKSIIIDMSERKIPKRSVWLFFGAVTRRDLFYVDFFRELQSSWPVFRFVPALAETRPEDQWSGETGLIPDVAARYLESRINPASPKEAYLCGSPGFVNAAIRMLAAHGVPREKIYFDRFM